MERNGRDGELIRHLRREWSEAERRLYPLATSLPELYIAAVDAVQAVAIWLRGTSSHDELVERWSQRAEVLGAAGACVDDDLPPELPRDHLLGAAFALRDRELSVAVEADERRELVDQARRRGDRWVRLHERGDATQGLFDPYQCIDLHLSSNLAVVATVEPDPSTGGPNHVVSVVELSADGGDVVGIGIDGFDDRELPSVDLFAAARDEVRELVEQADRT